MDKKIICFIHIERAGGTSLHHILHHNFKHYKTLTPWKYETNSNSAFFSKNNLEYMLANYNDLQGFGGHTTRSFLNYEEPLKDSVFYFTFLREPISRYMSHFNYQRQVMKIDWKIEDFIEDPHYNNFQTFRIINEIDSQKAFMELKKYSFVGISNNYDESLLLLKQVIDFADFNPLYEKKNELIDSSTIIKFNNLSETIQQKIIKNNEADIELFNKVKETIFKEQKERYKGNLQDDLNNHLKSLEKYKYNSIKAFHLKIKKASFRYFFEKKATGIK